MPAESSLQERVGRPDGSPLGRVRGVLFDVDGTLYWQAPLRVLMAAELGAGLCSFRLSRRDFEALKAFRHVRETLRDEEPRDQRLERWQYSEAARRCGSDAASLERVVEEWMYRRPLKYLRPLRRPGLAALLDHLARVGMPCGVLSDYPAEDKLEALGVRAAFSAVLSAVQEDVDRFKPHPRGFERAAAALGLEPGSVLYVGDRVEVDAVGAVSAGLPCWIVTPRGGMAWREAPVGHYVGTFAALRNALDRS